MTDTLILTNHPLHLFNAAFQFRTVVNVNMTIESMMTYFFFFMGPTGIAGHILPMPFTQVIQHFCTYLAFLIEEVGTFVNTDNNVKKIFDAFARTRNGRNHRNTKEFTQFHVIQRVATGFQFIVHIERHHHTHVHVNQLGSEVQITFQIGRIYHIDNNVRCFINNMMTDIHFFRTIC